MGNSRELSDEAWKRFLRRHWKATSLLIGGIAAAAIAALLVFLWVVADGQATGLVPVMIGEWTVGYLITFALTVILWEVVLVVSWVVPTALVIYFKWYRKLPEEERREYEGGPRRGRSAGGGSGFSFFVGLIWLIIVWTTGKWNLTFQAWTVNDLVFSWLAAFLWVLLIAGVFGTIYVVWSLRRDQIT
jgi:hypothetical protein